MDINMNKSCPHWMLSNMGFPNDGEGTHLEEVLTTNLKLKADICSQLGLTDGRLLLNAVNDKAELPTVYPTSLKVMRTLCGEYPQITDDEIFANKIGDLKVSKIALKKYSKGAPTLTDTDATALGLILYNSDAIKSELKNFNWRDADAPNILDTFVQNFYSSVSTMFNTTTMFSMHPLDILNAANSTAYTSCFAENGMFCTSTYKMMGVLNAGVIMITNAANKVLGRRWVFFSPKYGLWRIQPEYGTGATHEQIDSIISTLITNTGLADKNWKKQNGSGSNTMISNIYEMYLDDVDMLYYCTETPFILTLLSTPLQCLKCGDISMGLSNGMCNTCRQEQSKCKRCGRVMWKASASRICVECASKFTTCKVCGEVYDVSLANCPGCEKKNRCVFCASKDNLSKYCDNTVCKTCKDLIVAGVCSTCNQPKPVLPLNGKAYCRTCLDLDSYTKL